MGDLTTKERKHLKKSQFGEPGERKYPMEDKPHARDAKARASEEEHKGNLSKSAEERIDAKADRILHEHAGKVMGKHREYESHEHREEHREREHEKHMRSMAKEHEATMSHDHESLKD